MAVPTMSLGMPFGVIIMEGISTCSWTFRYFTVHTTGQGSVEVLSTIRIVTVRRRTCYTSIYGYHVYQNARGGLFGHLGDGNGGANFFEPSS